MGGMLRILNSIFNGCMRYSKFISFFIGVAVLVLAINCVTFAKSKGSDFVDLTFTIGSKSYFSKGVKKEIGIAPFTEKATIMVPFNVVLEELGYRIKYNKKTSYVTAIKTRDVIKFKIGSETIIINGKSKKLAYLPKLNNDVLVVPIDFISHYAGANVVIDNTIRNIYITKPGKYDTGKVMFYEKSKNKVYVYDGASINVISIDNKEIVNWYSHKGQVLATVFDKSTNKNNFVMYKNNDFKILIDDFDIKEAFEYNDNLIIHGYDRGQKYNKLYRFDGTNLIIIENNFYVGQHIIFKDKLVINKYDNTRKYTLLAFDKTSWTPGVLSQGFIIKGSLDCGNMLYMTGIWESGTKKPFVSYSGNTKNSTSFEIINENIDIDLNKVALCNGKLYALISSKLYVVEKNSLVNVTFPVSNQSCYINYGFSHIKTYKNKLYLGITGASFVDSTGKPAKTPSGVKVVPSVLEVTDVNNTKVIIDTFYLSEFRIENNRLIILGRNTVNQDPELYVFDGNITKKTLDVLAIKNTLSLGDKIFIDIRDKDRIANKDRNTMLLIDGSNRITNLVLGIDTKKWSIVSDSLLFAGYEEDLKKNKLYSYSNQFRELMSDFEIKYWGLIADKLFVSIYNPVTKSNSLFRFINDKKVELKRNIEVISMIKAKGSYYLVYAVNRDSKSPLNGRKVLYIYNDSKRQFVEMKTDIELTEMIFME